MGNCSIIFILVLFIITSNQKKKTNKPKCPSEEKWIKKIWYIYKVEYSLAVKINDIMKVAYKWMELENIIPS